MLKHANHNLKMLIGNLPELRELYLDGVHVFSKGDEWCHALSFSVPKLEVLSTHGYSLSDPIDPSLVNLSYLPVINLSYNNLSFTNISSALPNSIGNHERLSK